MTYEQEKAMSLMKEAKAVINTSMTLYKTGRDTLAISRIDGAIALLEQAKTILQEHDVPWDGD